VTLTMAGMSTSVSRRLVMELLPLALPCSVVRASWSSDFGDVSVSDGAVRWMTEKNVEALSTNLERLHLLSGSIVVAERMTGVVVLDKLK
jgi:hypothetical protein